MAVMLSATFDTRREAEMTVERLVQQFELGRAALFITSEGAEDSAIVVTVEVPDDNTASKVRDAFSEFDAAGVVETNPVAR